QKILQNSYADALRIIREAKIIDLHNLYVSALEHLISISPPGGSPSDRPADIRQLISVFVERALVDNDRRTIKRNEQYVAPDQQTLEQEKMKNLYFQRTDEMLEKKEYKRALEEVRRIYHFEPANIVAQEYEQKIRQIIDLQTTNE
ncbi:MAG: hypothetical protein HYV29_02325, partial [Ignavibacteriales bacterium]|nr:hypothetical protein [Ignavibacteriales bacterium]